ncbi:MAG: hypothetical protein LBR11_08170 [Deltaproteobacteria bacterium]|nr:hypothetical protein [Deltaproteobacteria bacterium]
MPVSRVLSVCRTIKSLEAESRLGFIADVSMLFADKGERGHIDDLVKQTEDQELKEKPRSVLSMDNERGVPVESRGFIPGKSYVIDNS